MRAKIENSLMYNWNKMTKHVSKLLLIVLFAGLFASCISDKKIIYIQGADKTYALPQEIGQAFELRIQPDDQLAISVTSKDKSLIDLFNNNTLIGGGATANGTSSGSASVNNTSGVSYFRVDNDGNIAFPIYGPLNVGGKTTGEVSAMIQDMMRNGYENHPPYILDAIVTTKIMSFKVTVLGDVHSPGNQTFTGERLTVLEAIGRAGDLNNSAKRYNVLVVREENGKRVVYEIDLTKEESVFKSEAYFLQQNDVVYVSPNKSVRVKGSTSYTLLSVSSTLVGMAVSIVSLIISLTR